MISIRSLMLAGSNREYQSWIPYMMHLIISISSVNKSKMCSLVAVGLAIALATILITVGILRAAPSVQKSSKPVDARGNDFTEGIVK